MKKYLILCLCLLIGLTGCGEETNEDLIGKLEKNINTSKSYTLTGEMEIFNGEDKFTYDLEANHLEEDYYKVKLINKTNNHEQIILRNTSGVYVITPSLNKSFKFDSVWPENSSQAYLLESIYNDINKDENYELTKEENGYIIKSSINYPNNSNLMYQKIYFDKDMIPTKVEVYDKNESIAIMVKFNKVNMNAGLKEENFVLDEYIDQNVCEETCTEEDCPNTCSSETSSLDGIIYPLYVPANTSLTSSEEISNELVNRAILTFAGEKNFVLIEEASNIYSNHEIVPINGNPIIINDTIAAMSTNSIYFSRNNIDYYIVSNDLTNEEMVSIASSIGSELTVSATK